MEKIKNVINNAITEISIKTGRNDFSGIRSGFTKLDSLTQGFQGGELTVIASRPGMGKSSFLISLLRNAAVDFNHNVLFFSLESKAVTVVNKILSTETGIEIKKIRGGNLEPYEWEQLHIKSKKILESSIFIDDKIDFSIEGIYKRAEESITEKNIEIIFIDYIQLINTGKKDRQNREEELSKIVKRLKHLARKYNIPIVVTSQLSRNIENRGGSKRPLLIDIRDSGAIEDDADIVAFLYRPEYYGMTEWDDDDHAPCEGQAELIIAKYRNGKIDNIRLNYTDYLSRFSDLKNNFIDDFESSMNKGFNEEVSSSNFSSPKDAFGANGDDVPF